MTTATMTVQVRYFAAAAEAAGLDSETISAPTLGGLLEQAVSVHGADLGRVLERCSILIDGERTDDPEAPLRDGQMVDVLPPFAGG